jgi:hypothetical protein
MFSFGKGELTDFVLKCTHLFVIFNATLVTFGLPYTYILGMSLSLFLCLIIGVSKVRVHHYLGHIGYVVLLLTITLINMSIGTQDLSALVTLGLYTLPILCWILYFSKADNTEFCNIFSSLFIWSVIISLLGILQYFLSPSLWGTIPTESKSIEWAMEKPFIEYAAFFRATSTLGSPQVFGLFCALNLILAHRFKYLIHQKLFLLGGGGLLVGGALSGNKSFFLIVFIYFFANFLVKYIYKLKSLFLMVSIVVIFISTLQTVTSNIPMLERIFSFENIASQEKGDSRLGRYYYIIENSDFFLGNGMGKDVVSEHEELTASESYIFKIYFECGFFTAMGLCLLMIMTMIKAWLKSFQDFIIVGLIFFSMLIVHAFQSPVFFIFWGYLLSLYHKGKPKRFV